MPKIVDGSSSQSLLSRPTDNGAMSMEGAKEPKKKEKKKIVCALRAPPRRRTRPVTSKRGRTKGASHVFPFKGPGAERRFGCGSSQPRSSDPALVVAQRRQRVSA